MPTQSSDVPQASKPMMQKILDTVERIGNAVPHPVVIFLILIAIVMVLSHILYWFGAHVNYQVINPDTFEIQSATTKANSLLTADGIRHIYTRLVPNFLGFSAVGLLIVAMIGVGVAEEAGLINALIRKLVTVSPAWALTYILALIGILSSIASDAGYLVLIPLAGAAFLTINRNPLAGLALGFAAVASAFSVNMLIKPLDAVLTELTNDAIHMVDPTKSIDLTANLWFSIVSVLVLTVLIALVTERIIEPRLGKYPGAQPSAEPLPQEGGHISDGGVEGPALRAVRPHRRAGVLRALDPAIGSTTAQSGDGRADRQFAFHDRLDRPHHDPVPGDRHRLRDRCEDSSQLHRRHQCDDQGGLRTGRHHPAVRGDQPVRRLFQLQQHADPHGGYRWPTCSRRRNIGSLWLLIGFIIVVIAILDLFFTPAIAKWAIFAPVFVPLFVTLAVDPAAVSGGLSRRRFADELDHAAQCLFRVGRRLRPEISTRTPASARSWR